MFAFHAASAPTGLMDELEKFIDFWCGPRRPEYGEPEDALQTLKVPYPLRRLYAFAGRWPPMNDAYAYVGHLFGVQDHLVDASGLKHRDDGKLVFLWENQGNWKCATLADGDDPPVWIDDWVEGTGAWLVAADSLARFLVSYCLQELLYGSKLCVSDPSLTELFDADASSTPLWMNGPYTHPGGKDHNFCLWRESVLVWKGQGTHTFGANSVKGIDYLNAHQGEITELKVDVERWTLNIRADGSGEIDVRDSYDSKADVPVGTFDFQAVRDRLLAARDDHKGLTDKASMFLIRRGQTSFKGSGVRDTEIVGALYKRALQFAVNKQPGFERWLKDHPPLSQLGS